LGAASVSGLLAAWREADRLWERQGSPDEVRDAALRVIEAYVAYQTAALPAESGEFIMIADDNQVYVAATSGVTKVLGYDPAELVGRRVEELAAPELREATPDRWAAFVAAGRQDGRFRLRAQGGTLVSMRYQARAHCPVAGFHISRLWPDDAVAEQDDEVVERFGGGG
jgi:PAS domain S-box-containing protein